MSLQFNHLWKRAIPFQSAQYSQDYLLQCYQKNGFADAEKHSYNNCYPFMYYLEHGKNYYKLAYEAPVSIQPVLLFYGMVQLIKACILTNDVHYPSSTSVLAHGVSTRKRKKQDYDFLDDEVKIQKNGLFTHISKIMFNLCPQDNKKYTMVELLKRIPELNHLFFKYKKTTPSYPIGKEHDNVFYITNKILDDLNMTKARLVDFLKNHISIIEFYKEENDYFLFKHHHDEQIYYNSPLYYNLYENMYYIPNERDLFADLPEVIVHYLILYNLSMICRYETNWWSELYHTFATNDYPFISEFLQTTAVKIPFYLFTFLDQQN
jgi:hypothetical protein